MGNAASEIAERVSQKSLSDLEGRWKEDQEVLSVDLHEAGSVSQLVGLDQFKLPGEIPKKEDSDTSTALEVQLALSKNNIQRFKEKFDQVREALLKDIWQLRGKQCGSKEYNTRLRAAQKLFEAILAENARTVKAAEEDEQVNVGDKTLNPMAEAAIKFGITSLLSIARRMGRADPELLKELMADASDILSTLPALSLSTSEVSLNYAIDKITEFFGAILNNKISGLSQEDQLLALQPLFGLSIATGSLSAALSVSLRFLTVTNVPEGLTRGSLPSLQQLKKIVDASADLKWNLEKKADGIKFDTKTKIISYDKEDSWGAIFGEKILEGDSYYLEFEIIANSNNNLHIGIADQKYENTNSSGEAEPLNITYGSNGQITKNASSLTQAATWDVQGIVGLFVNMSKQTLQFYYNNQKQGEQIQGINAQMKLFISMSGTDVKIKPHTSEVVPPEVAKVVDRMHVLKGIPEFEEIEDEDIDNAPNAQVLSAYILKRLEEANSVLRSKLLRGQQMRGFQKKQGITLDLQPLTIELLQDIIKHFIQHWNQLQLRPELKQIALNSVLRLLKGHLLSCSQLKNSGIPIELRRNVKQTVEALVNTIQNPQVNKEATAILSDCFDIFYMQPSEKLEFLLTCMSNVHSNRPLQQIDQDILQNLIEKLEKPSHLFQALKTPDHTVRDYLRVLTECAASQSIQSIQGHDQKFEFTQLLVSSQKALMTQFAAQKYNEEFQSAVFEYCNLVFDSSSRVLAELKKIQSGGELTDDLLNRVKKTIIYSVLPNLMDFLVLCKNDLKIITSLLPKAQEIVGELSSYDAGKPVLVDGTTIVTKEFESPHNYLDNQNETYDLTVPGTTKYILTFDPQCHTENSCDYLQLFSDRERTNQLHRWEGTNFPKEPLAVSANNLVFFFHSDSSVTYWGWKIQIEAHKKATFYMKKWPAGVQEACNGFLGNLCVNLITNDFELDEEDSKISQLLMNPLVKFGISDRSLIGIGEAKPLPAELAQLTSVREVTERPNRTLTKKVGSDKGKQFLIKQEKYQSSLRDYVEQYQAQSFPENSLNPFFQQLIEGPEKIVNAWKELKKQSQVTGGATTIGGSELNQLERVMFGVYLSLFNVVETGSKLFENAVEVNKIFAYLVKQACNIRTWAQQIRQARNSQGGNVGYDEISEELMQKAMIILHADFRKGLNELGINKVMTRLTDSMARQLSTIKLEKQGSRWNQVKGATGSVMQLKGLLDLGKKDDDSSEEIQEINKVAAFVKQIIEFDIPLDKLSQAVHNRRIRGLARALGLYYFGKVFKVADSATLMFKNFGDALRTKNSKLHYWEGIEGTDQLLQAAVQKAFYKSYGAIQSEIHNYQYSKLTASSLQHFLNVLEAMAYPFKDVDSLMVLDLQLSETVVKLLTWAKGHFWPETNNLIFNKSKCITDIKVARESELSENQEYILLHEPADEEEKMYLVIERDENAERFLTEYMTAEQPNEEYEDLFGAVPMGESSLHIMVKRDIPKPDTMYITKLQTYNTVQTKEYKDLMEDIDPVDSQKRQSKKEHLSKMSYKLFKLILLSCVGNPIQTSESLKIVLQDMFLNVITKEFNGQTWQKVDYMPMDLTQLANGAPWLGNTLANDRLVKNPMAEWLRLFKRDTQSLQENVLKEAIDSYTESIDPATRGVMNVEDVELLKHEARDLLQGYQEQVVNRNGQYDFFKYLKVLMHNADELGEEAKKFIQSSHLFQNLPEDFYEAEERWDFSNATRVIGFIRSVLGGQHTFGKYLTVFEQHSDKPGVVPKDQVKLNDIPQAFYNGDNELDLYFILRQIQASPADFAVYNSELKPFFDIYHEVPQSCGEIYKRGEQISQYYGSILWTLNICMLSGSLNKALSKYIPIFIKSAFFNDIPQDSIPAFRILRSVASTQQSPETMSRHWEHVDSASFPQYIAPDCKDNFVAALFSLIGLRTGWQFYGVDYRHINRKAFEAENILRALFLSQRWKSDIMDIMLVGLENLNQSLSEGSHISQVQAGIISFLGLSSLFRADSDTVLTEWAQVKLEGAAISQGTVVAVMDDELQVYSEEADNVAKVTKSTIRQISPQISGNIYEKLTQDDKQELMAKLGQLWNLMQNSEIHFSFPDPSKQVGAMLLIKKIEAALLEALSALADPISQRKLHGQEHVTAHKHHLLLKLIKDKIDASQEKHEYQWMTPEQAQEKIQNFSEDDQIIIAELTSQSVSIVQVITAMEAGEREPAKIIAWKPPEPVEEQNPLFTLQRFDDEKFDIVDLNDTAAFYQGQDGHMYISCLEGVSDKKSMTRALDTTVFNEAKQFVSEITILATIAGKSDTHKAVFGFQIGSLELGIESIVDRSIIYLNDEEISSVPTVSNYSIRIFARADGQVIIRGDNFEFLQQLTNATVFNGIKIGDFGVFLKEGKWAVLKGLQILPQHTDESIKYWKEDESEDKNRGARFVKTTVKHPRLTAIRLGLTGAPQQVTDHYADQFFDFEHGINSMLENENIGNWPSEMNEDFDPPVVDVRLIDSSSNIPEGFKLVPIIKDGKASDQKLYNKKTLVYKEEVQEQVTSFITDIQIEEGEAESIGDFTVNTDNDHSNTIRISKTSAAEIKSNEFIRNLLLVIASDHRSVKLPMGYKLVANKERLSINLAPQNEKNYYLFLAYTTQPCIRGCPIKTMREAHVKESNFGIVDYFDDSINRKEEDDMKEPEKLSLLELTAKLHQLEEQRVQEAGKSFMLVAVKNNSASFISTAEKKGIGYLLNMLKDDLEQLDKILDEILRGDNEGFKRKLVTELAIQLIISSSKQQGSTGFKVMEFESNHPYENNLRVDETISVPGAQSLLIEFDPQCNTESGCDVLRFYKKPNHEEEIKAISGTGSNWQSFEVEGDTVYIYFYTDGSQVEWGYKFKVTPRGLSKTTDPLGKRVSDNIIQWLLKHMLQSPSSRGLSILYTQAIIVPLFIYSFNQADTDFKVYAINALLQLLDQDHGPLCRYIVNTYYKQVGVLYKNFQQNKIPNPILQSILQVLINKVQLLSGMEEWFSEYCDLYYDMRGLAEKTEYLETFLFERYRASMNVTCQSYIESSHPYSNTTQLQSISLPGASSLRIEFDQQSALDQGHEVYFTYDPEGLNPVETKAPPKSSAGRWADDPKGPEIQFSNENMTVTRTDSEGWGNAIWSESYDTGKVTIRFHIDNDGESGYLYIGAYQADQELNMSGVINSECVTNVWSWKKTGDFYKKGVAEARSLEEGYSTGDTVALVLDMDEKSITFVKNGADVFSFTGLADSVRPVISFGGDNQLVTVLSVEISSGQSGLLNSRKLQIQTDSVYMHYPINAGFLTNHRWQPSSSPLLAVSADHKRLYRVGQENAPIVHTTDEELQAGKHYVEVQIGKLQERQMLLIGFIPESLPRNQSIVSGNSVVYRSQGSAFFSGQTVACKGFEQGDKIGCYLDFAKREARFYKNGKQIASARVEINQEPYKYAVMFTSPEQEVRLMPKTELPEDLDLLRISRSDKINADSWGLKVIVTPTYFGRSISKVRAFLNNMTEQQVTAWQGSYLKKYANYFIRGTAEELVMYLDELSVKADKNLLEFLPEDLSPEAKDLALYPNLEKVPLEDMRELMTIIIEFNKKINSFLTLLDLKMSSREKMTEMQRALVGARNFMFFRMKKDIMQEILEKTKTTNQDEITIDRPMAARHRDKGEIDVKGQFSIYGQLYRIFNQKANSNYRNPERIFKVNYRGEGSIDAGGPYNEVMSNICEELQSNYLKLFVKTPNNANNLGEHRDCWTINPAFDQPQNLDLYFFLGKLFGAAIRTQNNLNLALPPLFWKNLMLDQLTLYDLKGVDEACYQMIDILRDLDNKGITRDTFSFAFTAQNFTTTDSSGRVIELMPGGNDIEVNFDNATEFADLIQQARLSEAQQQYAMLRRGISASVPIDLLNMFSWRQCERLVCGAADIDVEILKSNTEYDGGLSENDQHVIWFWEVLTEFTPLQRTQYLKFVWGRSRLPASRNFKKMKINNMSTNGVANNYMPVSHTCFFTLDLPRYTSKQALHDKLLYASTHCKAIDLDNAAVGGWDEEE